MLCLGPPGTAFPIFKPSPSFLRKVRGHMLTIRRFTCENQSRGCVTDERAPRFGFSLDSDRPGAALKRAVLTVNGWRTETADQIAVPYGGAPLVPFTRYTAKLTAVDDAGEEARGELEFETGRLDTPGAARWISDGTYSFTEKRVSPVPMTFRKTFALRGEVRQAKVYATAMGIYALTLNGGAVGEDYFTPGFTSYETNLQYQTYDVTELLRQDNTLTAVVAGGWAVGSFVFTRKNRVTADRQALLLELRLTYADGTQEVIGTDETWQVTEEGPCGRRTYTTGRCTTPRRRGPGGTPPQWSGCGWTPPSGRPTAPRCGPTRCSHPFPAPRWGTVRCTTSARTSPGWCASGSGERGDRRWWCATPRSSTRTAP